MFEPEPLTVSKINPLFKKCIYTYSNYYDIDLSYMKVIISEVPLNTNGKPTTEITPDMFGGCWTKNKTIGLNKYFEKTVKYYHKRCTKPLYEKTLKIVILHELAHEVWQIADSSFKNRILKEVEENKFNTEYLKTLNPNKSKYREEQFCEYVASLLYKKELRYYQLAFLN